MQADLFKHILGMSMGFFNRHRTGELVSRLDKDTNAVTSGLEDVVIKLLVGPALVLFYGFLLIRTSSMLALAAGAAVLLHFALTRGVQNPIKRRVADQFNAFANLAAGMFETILSIRVVKSFAGEEYEHEKLKADIQSVVETNMRYGVFKHLQEPIRLVINYFLEASIVLIAGIALIAGDLNVASFILFLYVGRATLRPIAELATAITGAHTALGASTRVLQLFDQQPEVMDGPLKIESFNDSIAIKNVTFAYGEAPAIRDVSLEIKKGEQVAFVGPSGAGKSTLSDLLLRFYDPQEGNILIDGIDIREFEQRSLRKLFGVVPQEPLLFNATIEENITYGRSNITRQDILAATEIANAHSFVSNLPNGYDTFVGDRGIRLSGGQRQRIAIARAVAGKPSIMIFDEATSSLDSESERLVQEAVDRVLKEVTGIIIAHRLSTILRADKIVVVNDGLIEAVGRHEELRETSQTYRHLLELQSLVPEIA
jgi:subfamily B ATP-binding cassette protein MsbA